MNSVCMTDYGPITIPLEVLARAMRLELIRPFYLIEWANYKARKLLLEGKDIR